MDVTLYASSDVVLTIIDHPQIKDTFLLTVTKDRFGSMESLPDATLGDDYLMPLMKAASYSGRIEQESTTKAHFYFMPGVFTSPSPRQILMQMEDFYAWIVQVYGPPEYAAWAAARRLKSTKPLTLRQLRLKAGECPDCGSAGQMVRTALICRTHGPYAGI